MAKESEKIDSIQRTIGELLANGYSEANIIAALQEDEGIEYDEACKALRQVFMHWQNTRESLDLQDVNLLDWHVVLRKRILRSALEESTIPGLKLALSVLDSLATIQKLTDIQSQTIPISIILTEKKELPHDAESDVIPDFNSGNAGRTAE